MDKPKGDPPASVEGRTDATPAASSGVSASATWRRIDEALSPVIGQGGMLALYRRSLHLTASTFPWIDVKSHDADLPSALATLETTLLQQEIATANIASRALLNHFRELLAGLLGTVLTERLLLSVWPREAGGHFDQDTPR